MFQCRDCGFATGTSGDHQKPHLLGCLRTAPDQTGLNFEDMWCFELGPTKRSTFASFMLMFRMIEQISDEKMGWQIITHVGTRFMKDRRGIELE